MEFARDDFTATWQLRETQRLLAWADAQHGELTPEAAAAWIRTQPDNHWQRLIAEAVDTLAGDHAGPMPVSHFREWLAEWARDRRRTQTGLLLTSAHRAKGLEFDHVLILDGHWQPNDDLRRLYYVAMSRARETLTLIDMGVRNPFISLLRDHSAALCRDAVTAAAPAPPGAHNQVKATSLRDNDLSYAGRSANRNLPRQLAALQPGDPLQIERTAEYVNLKSPNGTVVGRLSQRAKNELPADAETSARVLAIATWSKNESSPQFHKYIRRDHWEVVIPELTIVRRSQP